MLSWSCWSQAGSVYSLRGCSRSWNEPDTSSKFSFPRVKHAQFLPHSWLNKSQILSASHASRSGTTCPLHALKEDTLHLTPPMWAVSEKMTGIITSCNLHIPTPLTTPKPALSFFQQLWHAFGLCLVLSSVCEPCSLSKARA